MKNHCISQTFVYPSSHISLARSDTKFGSDMNIATMRDCIGITLVSVKKMPQMSLSINDALGDRSTAIFSTILSNVRR